MIGWVLRNAVLIDGTGAAPAADTDIHVIGDRIVAIGADLAVPDGTREVDATGRWVVPGLIDAHVHLMNIPGEQWLGLTPEEADDTVRAQLRAYLAAGVTTVLDVGTVPARMEPIRRWVADGAAAPRIVGLGRVWGPAGGYPSNFDPAFAGLSDRASVQAAFDENVALGAVGVKLTFERGFAPKDDWPLYDPALRTAIREEAGARNLPLYVHAMTPSEFLPAAEVGPRAFVHAPDAPVPAVTEAIVRSGASVVTTMSVYDAPLLALDRDALADPTLVSLVPPRELAAALDRDTAHHAREAIAQMVLPGLPKWIARMGFGVRLLARQRLNRAIAAVRALHEAGVPLVLGTDSGTWTVFHTQFHGWASLHELELLWRAGLSGQEALRAGTIDAARLIGLGDEIGTVEVGKSADLVVLSADPLADPRAYRSVLWTARGGLLHTPAEWLTADR